MASAVCEYRCSTSDSALLAYATIFRSSCPGLFCVRIADNPLGDASVGNSVSLFESKYAMTVSLVSIFLILLNDCSCFSPY